MNGNTVAIADSVQKAVAELAKTLPKGVTLKAVYDQATLVRDATRSVRDAMIIGAVLAVIILFLFLRRARITAISAASIPLTLAITVFVMWLIGQTFNLIGRASADEPTRSSLRCQRAPPVSSSGFVVPGSQSSMAIIAPRPRMSATTG